MKLFITALALCLIATSYCADVKPGKECVKGKDKCLHDSECKQADSYCPKTTCECKDGKVQREEMCKAKLQPAGEACEKDTDCEGNNVLKCVEKKCVCKTDKENYVKLTMTCTAKMLFGKDCKKSPDNCYDNMQCSTGNKCECKVGYEQDDDKDICNKKKDLFGMACTKAEDCGGKLECSGNKCACASGTPNYIKKTMECTSKVLFGGDCDNQKLCDTSMKCSTGKKCECEEGQEKEDDNDQKCSKKKYAKLGETCSDKLACDKTSLGLADCPTSGTKKCACPAEKESKEIYEMKDGKRTMIKKCVSKKVELNKKFNDTCLEDDTKEDAKYCGKDLMCKTCGGSKYLCRKEIKDTSGVGQLTFSISVVLGCYALKKIFM